MNSVMYRGHLMHHRLKPAGHKFAYRVFTWLFDLDEVDSLAGQLSLFSRNRFNLFSFYDRDYGDGSSVSIKEQVNARLVENGFSQANKILLLCSPRVMGYTFNPLSVYYCYTQKHSLIMIYEVSNTFGERHLYFIPFGNNGTQATVVQEARKRMHVSPFSIMACNYRFLVKEPGDQLSLNIEMYGDEGLFFLAKLTGEREPVNNRTLLSSFLSVPLQTVKVITLIHWQALKLWLKGIPLIRHIPAENRFAISRGRRR